jgi:hypothetical protein
MAVGRLLLQSFWTNEAIFQLMMQAYNLFLLFKMDFAGKTEHRQQIKTFRLKYIFLAGKIIRTGRSVVMKLLRIPGISHSDSGVCRTVRGGETLVEYIVT